MRHDVAEFGAKMPVLTKSVPPIVSMTAFAVFPEMFRNDRSKLTRCGNAMLPLPVTLAAHPWIATGGNALPDDDPKALGEEATGAGD